jgi:hypothetical protein
LQTRQTIRISTWSLAATLGSFRRRTRFVLGNPLLDFNREHMILKLRLQLAKRRSQFAQDIRI